MSDRTRLTQYGGLESMISFNNNSLVSKKFAGVQEMAHFINTWFDMCVKNKKSPTLGDLAVNLGCSREDLLEYDGDEQVKALINYAKTRIAAYMEQRIMDTKGTHKGEMFLLETNHGYAKKSVTETNVSGSVQQLVQFELPVRKKEEELVAANFEDVEMIESGNETDTE